MTPAAYYLETLRLKKRYTDFILTLPADQTWDRYTVYHLGPRMKTQLNAMSVINQLLAELVTHAVLTKLGDEYQLQS